MAAQKSKDQILAEYQQAPTLNQVGTAVGDIARIGTNAVSFGLANRLAALTGGPGTEGQNYAERLADQQAKQREAEIRAGLAGDVAAVAGYGGGLKTAWTAVKGLPAAAKYLAKNPALLKSLGFVGATAAVNQSRTASDAQSAAPAQPKAEAKPQQAAAAATPAQETGRLQKWAKEMGFKPGMTYGQMEFLSKMMTESSPRPVPVKDTILGRIYELNEARLAQTLNDPNVSAADKESAYQEFLNRYPFASNSLQVYAPGEGE